MKATLKIKHDGIRSHAEVFVDVGEPSLRACSLDSIVAAANQNDDAGTAAAYVEIAKQIATKLYLVIKKEIDGSRDNGCCWFAVDFKNGINGDYLTESPHRFTSQSFRGWNPTAQQIHDEENAILRRAAAIGFGKSEYWREADRTVDAVLLRANPMSQPLPDLLTTLQTIERFCEEEGSPFALSVALTARNALAKAKGTS